MRLDVDPVKGRDGSDVGAEHFKTFPCGEASYTALMYSVSMGQKAGNLITAAEAVAMTVEQLQLVKAHNGGKPIYIDQLLYTDSTPGFEQNARLRQEELGDYLIMLPEVLDSYTNGYAVWSYRNYANNPVYNCQFAWEIGDGRPAAPESYSEGAAVRPVSRQTEASPRRSDTGYQERPGMTIMYGLRQTVKGRYGYQ